ncbi:unnamed protein product [Amoebophrya sp. A120]|nr:unnamed protein product [Amoebophrya sp. A120]|eukprot:GSA120T00018171001.1
MADATADQEKYTEVLNELIPYISEFVDGNGGLASLSLLSQDPHVKSLQAMIPARYDKKLTKILEQYKDFFQCLEGGRVATYKAYESGLIDEEGRVKNVSAKAKTKMKQVVTILPVGEEAPPAEAAAPAFSPPEPAAAPEASLSGNEGGAPTGGPVEHAFDPTDDNLTDEMGHEVTLMDLMDQLGAAVFLEDGSQFVQLIQKMRRIRKETFGFDDDSVFARVFGPTRPNANRMVVTGGSAVPGQVNSLKRQAQAYDPNGPRMTVPSSVELAAPRNPAERNERLTLVTREMVNRLREAPGKMLTVIELTQIPKIQLLKKGIISKFTLFLNQNQDKFQLARNPEGENKSDVVTLIMDEVAVDELLTGTFDLDNQYTDMFPELSLAGPNAPGTGLAKKFQKKGTGKKGGKGYGYGGYY